MAEESAITTVAPTEVSADTTETRQTETEVTQTENITDKNPAKEMTEPTPNVDMSNFDNRMGTLQNQLDTTNSMLNNLVGEFSSLKTRLNIVETTTDEFVTPVTVASAIGNVIR